MDPEYQESVIRYSVGLHRPAAFTSSCALDVNVVDVHLPEEGAPRN